MAEQPFNLSHRQVIQVGVLPSGDIWYDLNAFETPSAKSELNSCVQVALSDSSASSSSDTDPIPVALVDDHARMTLPSSRRPDVVAEIDHLRSRIDELQRANASLERDVEDAKRELAIIRSGTGWRLLQAGRQVRN